MCVLRDGLLLREAAGLRAARQADAAARQQVVRLGAARAGVVDVVAQPPARAGAADPGARGEAVQARDRQRAVVLARPAMPGAREAREKDVAWRVSREPTLESGPLFYGCA